MIDNDKSKVAIAQSVLSLKENMAAFIEMHQYQAKITRAKYLALVKEGFTEAQAIELCKQIV